MASGHQSASQWRSPVTLFLRTVCPERQRAEVRNARRADRDAPDVALPRYGSAL